MRDPGLYDYLPYDSRRPTITWPNGAPVAVWVAPNLEFYELAPPNNPHRASWGRPEPDVMGYAYRDYGNRVGFQRMFEAMQKFGIRGSASLNVAMCDHAPEVIEICAEAGWEFYSHGIYNTRFMLGMSEDQERELIQDSIDTILKHTGQRLDGWLSPALSYTERTLEIVAEMGLSYVCDLFHDDQPAPLNVPSGKLVSIPYSLEMNDVIAYNVNLLSPRRYGEVIRRQFDVLYRESVESGSGTVMCIPIHPYLVGRPHRIAAFEEALGYIAGHDDVWFATGREIAAHFVANSYDDFVAAGRAPGAVA
ncbi:MAG: polysaccharide deacetylase family protein [Steroidobacteraceae bacterium]